MKHQRREGWPWPAAARSPRPSDAILRESDARLSAAARHVAALTDELVVALARLEQVRLEEHAACEVAASDFAQHVIEQARRRRD